MDKEEIIEKLLAGEMKLYQIDNNEYEFADLKIDTATRTPEMIVEMILDYLEKRDFIEKK